MPTAPIMHDEIDLGDVTPDLTAMAAKQAREATYRTLAAPLIRLGYAALPRRTGGKGKAPAVSYGHLTGQSKAANLAEMAGWDSSEPAALWLLDALPGSGAPDLDVLDVDDLKDLDWAISTFGPTPLTQSSGRDGGGVHLF